jgi:hypothetical protein
MKERSRTKKNHIYIARENKQFYKFKEHEKTFGGHIYVYSIHQHDSAHQNKGNFCFALMVLQWFSTTV